MPSKSKNRKIVVPYGMSNKQIKRARDSEETASTQVKQLRQQESEEK